MSWELWELLWGWSWHCSLRLAFFPPLYRRWHVYVHNC